MNETAAPPPLQGTPGVEKQDDEKAVSPPSSKEASAPASRQPSATASSKEASNANANVGPEVEKPFVPHPPGTRVR